VAGGDKTEVAALCAIEVTDAQWKDFLDRHIRVAEDARPPVAAELWSIPSVSS